MPILDERVEKYNQEGNTSIKKFGRLMRGFDEHYLDTIKMSPEAMEEYEMLEQEQRLLAYTIEKVHTTINMDIYSFGKENMNISLTKKLIELQDRDMLKKIGLLITSIRTDLKALKSVEERKRESIISKLLPFYIHKVERLNIADIELKRLVLINVHGIIRNVKNAGSRKSLG